MKSSVPSNAIQPITTGSTAAINSFRTYTKPLPQGESSHFCPPQERMSTGVAGQVHRHRAQPLDRVHHEEGVRRRVARAESAARSTR